MNNTGYIICSVMKDFYKLTLIKRASDKKLVYRFSIHHDLAKEFYAPEDEMLAVKSMGEHLINQVYMFEEFQREANRKEGDKS